MKSAGLSHALGFALGGLVPLGAAAAPTVLDPEIIVTATRRAQSADEALAAVTVITRAEIIAAQARDLGELLRFHAGLDLGRNGGPGQPASVFVRGTESNHALVLLDGVRLNPGTIGGAPWQNLDPALIDRIEIVRGPRSSLYGPDAIGGVIQIFTRRGEPGTSVAAMAGAGADGTHEGSAAFHHRSQGWRAGFELTRFSTDGFPARRETTRATGYDRTGVNAYAGVRLGAVDAEIGHWQVQGNNEYYDFALTPLDQDYHNASTQLVFKAPLAAAWGTTLRLARMTDRLDQNQSADFGHTRRTTLDWQHDLQLGSHLLTAGAFGSREQTAAASFGTIYDVETDSRAVYVQDEWHMGRHRVLVAWRYSDYDLFGSHHTGELAWGYEFSPATRAYATFGTGFRAPDGTDRFGYGGNPDLRPETSRNVEVGLRSRIAPGQQVHASLFHNDLDDLINYVDPDGFAGPQPGTNQNVDRARIRGIEAGWRWRAQPWTVDLQGVIQNPENRDTGRQLARRATRSLTLAGGYELPAGRLGLEMLATAGRWDSDFGNDRLPAYAVLNLLAEHRLSRELTLRARIENLFDKDYELADGYNVQGRALFVQLRYQPRIGTSP